MSKMTEEEVIIHLDADATVLLNNAIVCNIHNVGKTFFCHQSALEKIVHYLNCCSSKQTGRQMLFFSRTLPNISTTKINAHNSTKHRNSANIVLMQTVLKCILLFYVKIVMIISNFPCYCIINVSKQG